MRLICFLYFGALAAGLNAAVQGGPLGLGPRAMGRAGATVMELDTAEGLYWNPASLTQHGLELNVFSGSGGSNLPQQMAGSLGLGLDDFSVGLAYADGRYSGLSRQEGETIVGLAVPLGDRLSLGMNQRFSQAEPGGMRGWGMDFGLRGSAALPGWMGSRLDIGFSATDLASSLAWANGLEEVQPVVLRLGGALEPARGLRLAFQQDWINRSGGAAAGQWRAGGEAGFLDQRLVLRLGATRAQNALMYATAGLSVGLDAGGARWQLDYAYLASPEATGGLGQAARHLLSLGTHFGRRPRREPEAKVAKVLKDPRTGKVHHAKFVLSGTEGVDVQDWEFEVKDKKGKVVRTFKGKGALPPSLSWDGRSEAGALADAEGLTYGLRTTTSSGAKLERKSLIGAGLAAGGAAELAGLDGGFGLRGDTPGAAKPRVKPSLKGSKDFAVSGADFDLGSIAAAGAQEWELRIVDAEGKTVKKFAGKGKPPKSLRWEGKDDAGEPVVAELGAGFVLRVVDDEGKAKQVSDDLVQAQDFGVLAETARRRAPGRAPKPKPAAAAAPAQEDEELASGACRWDEAASAWVCVIPFDPGSRALDSEAKGAAREAAALLKKRRFASLEVAGHAGEAMAEEGRQALSQARAEAVLKEILAASAYRPGSVAATGLGDSLPVTPGHAAAGLVEVFLKD